MRAIKDEVQLLWDSWCQDPDKFLDRRVQNHSLKEFSKNKGQLRLRFDARAVLLWPADFVLKSDSQKQLWIEHESTPQQVFKQLKPLRQIEQEVKPRDAEVNSPPQVEGQLHLRDLWRSFITEPDQWSVDASHVQNATRCLVHKVDGHQLNVDDASTPDWAKQEFTTYQVTLTYDKT